MENLPELEIRLEVQLQDSHYLEETIAFQMNQKKFNDTYLLANENAIARAVSTAFQQKGYACDEVYCLLGWNIPGDYFGKSFCKAYLRDQTSQKIYLYQADLDCNLVDSYTNHQHINSLLTFCYISYEQDQKERTLNHWLKQTFSKLRSAIAGR